MKQDIIFSFVLLFFNSACTKHKDDVEAPAPKATIQFYSPIEDAMYRCGDSVTIRATAVAAATIHGYDLIVRRTGDTARLFFKHVHDHDDTLQINRKWKADTQAGALQAEVVLYLDHDANTAAKKVGFRLE